MNEAHKPLSHEDFLVLQSLVHREQNAIDRQFESLAGKVPGVDFMPGYNKQLTAQAHKLLDIAGRLEVQAILTRPKIARRAFA